MDKCENEDKAHEVNIEIKVSDNILKERIGKIMLCTRTHYC